MPVPIRWRPSRRRRVAAFLGASLLLHAIAVLVPLRIPSPQAPVEERPPQRFVKRLAMARRPLARRLLPHLLQRPVVRQSGIQSTPAVAVAPAPLTTQRQALQGVPVPLVQAPPPPSDIPVQPLASLPAPSIGPTFRPGALHGERTSAEEVDLGMELLDVDALDTGRRRALVIVDPRDRRGITGFLYLSGVVSESLERAEQESDRPRRQSNLRPQGLPFRQLAERETLQGLADRLTEHTGVRAQVRQSYGLDDPALVEVPFVLLTVNNVFEFTDAEAANLGRYLTGGGFLYAEVAARPQRLGTDFQYDIPTLRQLVRAACGHAGLAEGKDWRFRRLDMDHPLFHCYYDLDSLPLGFWDWTYKYWQVEVITPQYLEAIEVRGQVVGLYSQRNYADLWAGEAERIRQHDADSNLINGRFNTGCEELPAYNLAVNVLVYALTREGSLAQKLVQVE